MPQGTPSRSSSSSAIAAAHTEIRRHNCLYRLPPEEGGWLAAGDIMHGNKYHSLMTDTMHASSTHGLTRVGRHIAGKQAREEDLRAFNTSRFLKGTNAAILKEDMRLEALKYRDPRALTMPTYETSVSQKCIEKAAAIFAQHPESS